MFRQKRHFTITTRIHIVSPFFKFYCLSSGDKITVGIINMRKANLKSSCSCSVMESSCMSYYKEQIGRFIPNLLVLAIDASISLHYTM